MRSNGFTVAIDTVSPMLRRASTKLSPRGQLRMIIGWGHVVAQNAKVNAIRKGGQSFWKEVARSISVKRASSATAEVRATHVAARQKELGGPIVAKDKPLTIPIADESRRRTAADFSSGGVRLFAIGRSYDDPVDETGVLGYSSGGVFHALYALVGRTAPQKPDPFFPTKWKTRTLGEQVAAKILANP